MTKEAPILIRISAGDKKALQDAAIAVGKSLTTFIVEAAKEEALRLARSAARRSRRRGVPIWFHGICQEAAAHGGNGYEDAGYRLAAALAREIPAGIDRIQWSVTVQVLKDSLAAGDDEEVWSWFATHYPKFMDLVAKRWRDRFLYGVHRADEDGRIHAYRSY